MIIKRQKTKDYSTIANECFKNPAISARAKGLYGYLMTLPETWELKKIELYTHFTEGRDALNNAFEELIKFGYIHKKRTRNSLGKFEGWEYVVHEFASPLTENPKSVKPTYWKPESGKPDAGNPKSENPHLLNTNKKVNTKKVNTDNSNKENIKENPIDVLSESNLADEVKHSLNEFFENRKELAKANKKLILTSRAINMIISNIESDSYTDDKHRIESIQNA